MTIPSRHKVDLLAFQYLFAIDEVFQEFVESMSNMQVPIGIRRTIMQDETFGSVGFGLRREFAVEVVFFPEGLNLRFSDGSVGSLVKARVWQ